MNFQILFQNKNRIRVHLMREGERPGRIKRGTMYMTMSQADRLEYYLRSVRGVISVKVHENTGNAVIMMASGGGTCVREALSLFNWNVPVVVPDNTGRAIVSRFQDKIVFTVSARIVTRFLVPLPLRAAITIVKGVRYLVRTMRLLLKHRGKMAFIDLIGVLFSVIRGDFETAGSLLFLINLGEIFSEWTRRSSSHVLAQAMSGNADGVWLRCKLSTDSKINTSLDVKAGGKLNKGIDLMGGGKLNTENGNHEQGGATEDDGSYEEILVDPTKICPGDVIVLRSGSEVPFDGEVISGKAIVDERALTGASERIAKSEGSSVFAGSLVIEGECLLMVRRIQGSTRYSRILALLEEKAKGGDSYLQDERIGRRIGISTFGVSSIVYLLTRSPDRGMSIMLADTSSAIGLAVPSAVMGAMRECSLHDVFVVNGRALTYIPEAETVVFNKRGIVTSGHPVVSSIDVFGGRDEDEMLALAACLEEHYPHSMSLAVVREAQKRGLRHRKMHAKTEYIKAHGIVSSVNGLRVVLGSWHFVMEDERTLEPGRERKASREEGALEEDALREEGALEEDASREEGALEEDASKEEGALKEDVSREWKKSPEYKRYQKLRRERLSHIYMAINGKLAAMISIDDPVREDIALIISSLHKNGHKKVVLMTGDSEHAVRRAASEAGFDEYYSGSLPEDKMEYVRKEHEAGRKVIMVGDSINDAPAMARADVSIAVSSAVPLARAEADIIIPAGDLKSLNWLISYSQRLRRRIVKTTGLAITGNIVFATLGALGVILPQTVVKMHNLYSFALGFHNLTSLEKKELFAMPESEMLSAVMQAEHPSV